MDSRSRAILQNTLTEIQRALEDPNFTNDIEATIRDMDDILIAKGQDYAGDAGAEDTWATFRRAAEMAMGTPEGSMVYLISTKWARLISLYATPRQVLHEDSLKNLIDVANYTVLLAAWISYKQDK